MIRYLGLRFLLALPALWLILTMVFLLAHVVPGDPVQQMLGEGARAEDLQQLRHALALDLPLPVQYGRYLAGIAHGNLGESFRFQQPVARVVLSHYPATLELAIVALLVCAAIGIPAGMLAAQRRGRTADRADWRLDPVWPFRPEFCARPRADLAFLRDPRMAPRVGPRRPAASHPPGGDAGRRAGRNPDAHGAHVGDRRAFERLRAHGASQRPCRIRGSVSPRISQRLDSDSYDSRIAVRDAPRRYDRHGIDFLLAGNRASRRASDWRARLPACSRAASS